jgi:hypothetical protein
VPDVRDFGRTVLRRMAPPFYFSTFILSLILFWIIPMAVEAALASEMCFRFRNRDILGPSSLLCIREKRDRNPCIRIPYPAFSLTSPECHIIPHLLFATRNRGIDGRGKKKAGSEKVTVAGHRVQVIPSCIRRRTEAATKSRRRRTRSTSRRVMRRQRR